MFGDMPLPVKFFIAFMIVLALIGGIAWLVRRFGTGALSTSTARGRQARLGVIEATAIDSRRRLVLVRRDNIEHLIMLGGPSDVVVEANIVRVQAAAMRDVPPPRGPEPTGRPAAADDGSWPPAPEPTFRPSRGPERQIVPPSVADELPLQPHAEPPARAPAGDRLAGLAAEIARNAGRAEPALPRAEPLRRPPVEPRRPVSAPARAPEDAQASSDRHLAAMAQQLEAALRRPGQAPPGRESGGGEGPAGPATRRPAGEARSPLMERAMPPRASAPFPPPRASAAEPAAVRSEPEEGSRAISDEATETAPQPPAAPAAAVESSEPAGEPAHASEPVETRTPSLEEEMANLLGRPPGKT